ncbi:MAG: cytochrome c [Sandaracinaceae bacterium]|nr:MAG: cytochrome c [Sandaracinaceae bacterium]HBQ19957.1 hypothetical protein [Myxococcales bacterium]|tara:strand:- start:13 stop:465 length:453 start_codon:yes stop_codon:yes gene_type:complete
MTRLALMTAVALTLAACGGSGGEGAEEAHATSADYAGPIASADIARGETVYNQICMACHASGAPNLEGLGWDPARMRQQVREGEDDMPAIRESRLSADDLEAILAYMTTTGGVSGELPGGAGGAEPATSGGEGDDTVDDMDAGDPAAEEG